VTPFSRKVLWTSSELLIKDPTEADQGPEHIIAQIQQLYFDARTAYPLHSLGIGTPGSISAQSGLLRNSNTVCLNGLPLQSLIEKALGCAGVFWHTSTQLLLHDVVTKEELPGAVRLLATARYLGILVGPGLGGLILIGFGPTYGIFLNATFYIPTFLWLVSAPYGPAFRTSARTFKIPVRGLSDIISTFKEVSTLPVIFSMVILVGAASFFVGTSYQAQMPAFAEDLGHGDPGLLYSLLLAADAAGALFAGLVLSNKGWMRPRPRAALILAFIWCLVLSTFAFTHQYIIALTLLFVAGFLELSFNSMAQSLVQLNAPDEHRGRVIGLFNMFSLGMRAGAGVTVGLIGGLIGIHWSLGFAGILLAAIISVVMYIFNFKD